MSDQTYFIGYRMEHFTGYDGSGSPSYSSITSSDSSEEHSLGSMTLSTTGNVVWKDLNLSDDSIFLMVEIGSVVTNSDTAQYSPFVITDGTNAICLDISNYRDHTINNWPPSINIDLSYGTYDTTNRYKSTSNIVTYKDTIHPSSGSVIIYRFYINISKSSSSYDTIKVSICNSLNYDNIVEIYNGSISTTLSMIKSFYTSYTTNTSRLYYVAATNFDTLGGFLDYSLVSSVGSISDWGGSIGTINTYPINTSITTNGMSAYNQGDQITFLPSKQLTDSGSMMIPKAIFIDSSLSISSPGLNYEATSIVKNKTTSVTYNIGTAISPTTTIEDYQWVSYQNPSNLSDWTVADANTMEFGLKRTI